MRIRLELNRVKQDLMIDFGEVGSHLPDADLYACIHVQMTDRKGYFRLLQKSVTTSAIPINKAATPTIHKGKASPSETFGSVSSLCSSRLVRSSPSESREASASSSLDARAVPLVVIGVAFTLIGFYMKSGVKKQEAWRTETNIWLTNRRVVP